MSNDTTALGGLAEWQRALLKAPLNPKLIKTKPLLVRFWAMVDKNGPIFIDRHGTNRGRCWLWTGTTNGDGYGQIYYYEAGRRKRHYAHRLSLEWHNGESLGVRLACHDCDNPPCVNPDHLFAGSYRDNWRDALDKGRAKGYPHPRGEGHHKAKLRADQVVEMRRQRAAGASLPALGRAFGVHFSTADDIVKGRKWTHVGGPIDGVDS